jgi:hypothetical protein
LKILEPNVSLTSLLEQPDVRERFKAEFAKPKIALHSDTYVAPKNPGHESLVGAAFDYVLRFYAATVNDSVWARPWVAEKAVGLLERAFAAGNPLFAADRSDARFRPTGRIFRRGVVASKPMFVMDVKRTKRERQVLGTSQSIVEDAKLANEKFRNDRKVSSDLMRSALLLAQLDVFLRRHLLGDDFGTIDDGDVEDLRALLRLARELPQSPFVASRVCLLNPTFGEASTLVRGADADLLIDDTLIELKTTKELEFSAETFRQLMGYYTLSKIGGLPKGIRPKPVIRNIAMYSSRYGVFAKVSVDSVVNAKTFPAFVRWFVQRAKYGPAGRPTTLLCADGVRVTF